MFNAGLLFADTALEENENGTDVGLPHLGIPAVVFGLLCGIIIVTIIVIFIAWRKKGLCLYNR